MSYGLFFYLIYTLRSIGENKKNFDFGNQSYFEYIMVFKKQFKKATIHKLKINSKLFSKKILIIFFCFNERLIIATNQPPVKQI